MTKIWDGETPYDGYRRVLESDRIYDQYLLGRADGLKEGYRAAMNSPVVKALYGALEDLRDWQNDPPLPSYEEGWAAAMKKTHDALAAYEAGLKEKE